ncbi:MAG TPA: glycosyltransferase family 2 protein [Candidatus Wujingus californicus]|uniref:glycosyltransferase family 2 protein n=1 Tax=Candidatus Wujingus californicus TaxID=3367618 RepID=UPI00402563E4
MDYCPPNLSIIIACSRPKVVVSCLSALECQINDRFEVIVVGDINGLSSKQFKLHLKLLSCNEIHTNVRRNLGIKCAKGELIGFLDDDTIPEINWVDIAIKSNSSFDKILVGPEKPVISSYRTALIYAVCLNYFSEGTRVHVNYKSEKVSWLEIPFCNCIIPRKLFEKIGLLSVEIPWDMDDSEYCFRARREIVFENVPALAVRHDRYPDSIYSFLKYRWNWRVRTGEKIIEYPYMYLRVLSINVLVVIPWVCLFSACTYPVIFGRFISVSLMLYAVFMIFQIKEAIKFKGMKGIWMYICLMIALQGITAFGVQLGVVRALFGRIKTLVSSICRV